MSFKSSIRFLGFFDRLVLRVTGTFLIEDLVVLGACTASSTSCTEGSSGVAARVEGASAASFCGPPHHCKREQVLYNPKERKKE
jgi:hypothetical protein